MRPPAPTDLDTSHRSGAAADLATHPLQSLKRSLRMTRRALAARAYFCRDSSEKVSFGLSHRVCLLSPILD